MYWAQNISFEPQLSLAQILPFFSSRAWAKLCLKFTSEPSQALKARHKKLKPQAGSGCLVLSAPNKKNNNNHNTHQHRKKKNYIFAIFACGLQ